MKKFRTIRARLALVTWLLAFSTSLLATSLVGHQPIATPEMTVVYLDGGVIKTDLVKRSRFHLNRYGCYADAVGLPVLLGKDSLIIVCAAPPVTEEDLIPIKDHLWWLDVWSKTMKLAVSALPMLMAAISASIFLLIAYAVLGVVKWVRSGE